MRSVYFGVAVCAALTAACSSDEEDEGGGNEPGSVGLYVMIRNPDATVGGGRVCPASSGIEWDVGSPSNPSQDASCFVRSSGRFNVAGEGTDPQITPPNGRIRFGFAGTAEAGPNMTATIWTSTTLNLVAHDAPCTITTVSALDAGELLVGFDCPLLVSPDASDVACRASGNLGLAGCGT